MAILIPVFGKRIDDATQEEITFVRFFKTGWVYDASQLVNAPESRPPMGDDYAGMYRVLCEVATEDGITVTEQPTVFGLANGASLGGRVVIKAALDGTNKLLVLCHELAHEWLHKRDGREAAAARERKEWQAESVAYAVADHFGIRTTYSADYLLTWKADAAQLKTDLDVVTATALRIIHKLQRAMSQQQESTGAAAA